MAAAAVPPKATGRCAGAPWPQQLRGRAARRRAPRSSYDGAIGGEGGQGARSTDARLVSVAKLAPPTRQRHAPAAEDTLGNDDSNRLPVFGLARVRSGDLGSLILTVELPCVQSRDVRVDVQGFPGGSRVLHVKATRRIVTASTADAAEAAWRSAGVQLSSTSTVGTGLGSRAAGISARDESHETYHWAWELPSGRLDVRNILARWDDGVLVVTVPQSRRHEPLSRSYDLSPSSWGATDM